GACWSCRCRIRAPWSRRRWSPCGRSSGPRSATSRCARWASADVRVLALRALILALFLLAWEGVARAANPLLYVPPSAVLPALGRLLALESYPDLVPRLQLTLREILVAYALAIAAGLGCRFALGLNRPIGRAYGPVLA